MAAPSDKCNLVVKHDRYAAVGDQWCRSEFGQIGFASEDAVLLRVFKNGLAQIDTLIFVHGVSLVLFNKANKWSKDNGTGSVCPC